MLKRRQWIILWMATLVIVLVAIYVLQENFSAEWGIIDDHEIAAFLGEDGQMSLIEIPRQLLDTEVGRWGDSARYRPSYYFLRLLETVLWGNSATAWYIVRIAIFTFWFVSLLWVIRVWVGLYWGLLFVLIAMGSDYWADIFARLGPAETYCVFGAALYLVGYIATVRSIERPVGRESTIRDNLLMTIGAVIAMGSKENFLFFSASSLALLGYALLRKRRSLGLIASTATIMAYTIFVVGALAVYFVGHSMDIYANEVSADSRLQVLYQGILASVSIFRLSPIFIYSYLGVSVGFGLLTYSLNRRRFKQYMNTVLLLVFGILLLWGLFLSQYIFYNGAWPTGIRYDFPGVLMIPLFWMLLFVGVSRHLSTVGLGLWWKRGADAILMIGFLAVIQPADSLQRWRAIISSSASDRLWIVTIQNSEPLASYERIRTIAGMNRDKTVRFSQTIRSIAALSREDPGALVILESYNVWDFEPIASTRKFLLALGVRNPMFLQLHGYSGMTAQSELERQLYAVLLSASNGEAGGGFSFLPPNQLNNATPAVRILFRGDPDALSGRAFRIDY